jgi:hypothetical protein
MIYKYGKNQLKNLTNINIIQLHIYNIQKNPTHGHHQHL